MRLVASGGANSAGLGGSGTGADMIPDGTLSTSGLSLSAIHPNGGCSSSSAAGRPLAVGAEAEGSLGGRPNPRVYQVWSYLGGRNRFLCCGRCVTGPRIDFGYNCCAWSFIAVPSAFYFAVCAPYLWAEVHWLLPILTGLVLISTIVFLLLTSCTDPGIIPRWRLQAHLEGLDEEVEMATGMPRPVVAPGVDPGSAEPLCELTVEQEALGCRWCPTCKIVRPPRASHCRDCDNCVLTFDHHCPFVNNCVGQRNYGYFSMFLASTLCLGFAVVTGIGLYISHTTSEGGGFHGTWLMVLLVVIGAPVAITLLGVVCLMLFHAFLAIRGRTTRELLTGKVTIGGRTLFTLRGPSLIHARDRLSVPLVV